jgi:4-diphosphocytidyl-2-C-methyl-D-erythritol kinase
LPLKLVDKAPAKVNLTLRVIGRRADGYHDIESLVVFADLCDRLSLTAGDGLSLRVSGPGGGQTGADSDNLVLKAARALAARDSGIRLGAFELEKTIPVAAGLGGGSADAAAALRLLARANDLAPGDPRLADAARATGADVPVCLAARPRLIRGIGEILSEPIALPRLCAILVNPSVAVSTKDVFSRWAQSAKSIRPPQPSALAQVASEDQLLHGLARESNDLEPPAIALAPAIADVLTALQGLDGCRLARMSGSGATCFGLFSSIAERDSAANALRAKFPNWWVCETVFG